MISAVFNSFAFSKICSSKRCNFVGIDSTGFVDEYHSQKDIA